MASEHYTYVLTEMAEGDIDEIFEYISIALGNPDAASSFADEFEKKVEAICKSPKSGRVVENPFLRRKDIRRVLINNYIAYYLIDEEKSRIVILRVVYGRRDQGKIIKDF